MNSPDFPLPPQQLRHRANENTAPGSCYMNGVSAAPVFVSQTPIDRRNANRTKLQQLLEKAEAQSKTVERKRNPARTGDYLDFDDSYGKNFINIGGALLVGLALVLLYVMWFTDWIR